MSKKRLVVLAGLITVVLAVIFGLGLVVGAFVPRLAGFASRTNFYNTSTLLRQVRTLSELVTVQYVVEKVVVVEDVKYVAGWGENRVLMVAHGVVKAGLDLSQLEPGDMTLKGKKLTIKLPSARITDAYLDDKQTRVIERTTGLLRFFDKDLEQTARQNAINEIRLAAKNSGILKDATTRAETQLRRLFEPLGLEVDFD